MARMLGEILIESNELSDGKLKMALKDQERWGGLIGDILVRMGLCTEETVYRGLAKQQALPYVDLSQIEPVSKPVLARISADAARKLQVIPLEARDNGRTLVVATADPRNLRGLDEIAKSTGCRLVVMVAGPVAIAQARAHAEHEELGDATGEFKLVDTSGNTINLQVPEGWAARAAGAQPVAAPPVAPQRPSAPAPQPPAAAVAAPVQRFNAPVVQGQAAPAAGAPSETAEMARAIDELRREVIFLKSMIALLVEKGVVTREECLVRLKR